MAVTVPPAAVTVPPAALIRSAAASSPAASLASMMRAKPSRARPAASARPSPREAPVIMAVGVSFMSRTLSATVPVRIGPGDRPGLVRWS